MTNIPVGSTGRPMMDDQPADTEIDRVWRAAWEGTSDPASDALRQAVLRIPVDHPRDVVADLSFGGLWRAFRLAVAPMAIASVLGFVVGVTDVAPFASTAPATDTSVAVLAEDFYVTDSDLAVLMFGGTGLFEDSAS